MRTHAGMRRAVVSGTGGTLLLRSRHTPRIPALSAACAILLWLFGGFAGAAGSNPRSSVGAPLGRTSGPRMQPVLTPARISRVAIVPESRDLETWAYGHTHARREGWAQTDPRGQGVFLVHRRGTGWRIRGPLEGADGRPVNNGISAFAMAPNGEGWGVGQTGLIFHRLPGGPWRIDDRASALTPQTLAGITIRSDSQGIYGFAVGEGPTFLRLSGRSWAVDNAAGVGAGAELLGNVVSVAALDRENAWAVARGSRELVLYRRTAETGWRRQLTGDPMFDTAPSVNAGGGGTPTINQYVDGTSIATAGDVTWVAGAIQPVDSQRYASQRGAGTEPSRPFALRIAPDGSTMTSYCPPIYQLSDGGVSTASLICDHQFPLGIERIWALNGFPDGRVIAGGAGMYRFDGDRWSRAPDVAGLVASAAFHSANEGWIASNGNRDGSGLAASTSNVIGHWTTHAPPPSMLRRWPHPSREALEAVALDPSGRRAVAVGGAGTIAMLEPGVGFDVVRSPTQQTLHDVAWPADGLAFAVGRRGTILRYDGGGWRPDPASGRLTNEALHAIAFRSPNQGIAVGAAGTILRYLDGRWSRDRQSGVVSRLRLMAVDYAGDEAIAVGEKTTILIDRGSGWVLDREAPEKFKTTQEGRLLNLMSVTGLPDGRAFAGGDLSLLIERASGGRFERAVSRPILSGSIHTMEAAIIGGRLRLLASVGTSSSRFGGAGLLESGGWLFAGDEDEWVSEGAQRVSAWGPDVDAPVRRDAVFDVALGPDGRGFAVGGFPADLQDEDGHLGSMPSGSIWRVALGRDPEEAPGHARVPVRSAPDEIGFAFLADTACASGLCSAAAGMGVRADEVLSNALGDVEDAVATGAVRFVAFGGDFRRIGIPEELEPIRDLLDTLTVPAFAAIGDQDLFGGVGAGGEQLLASAGYYLGTFANRPAPWGGRRAPLGFVPVRVGAETNPRPGQARTHFAFDYMKGSRAAARVVFLDTSRATQQIPLQNPPADQDPWLQQVLSAARAEGIPAIVVMHQPLLLGLSTGAGTRAGSLTPAITAGGPTAVLASHEQVNRLVSYPLDSTPGVASFPVAILGTSGSPLGRDWKPERGAYHAWIHVAVPATPGTPVRITSIPILESVSLSGPEGRRVEAGDTLRFRGLARLPDVGGGHVSAGGSPNQVTAQYMAFPYPRGCAGGLPADEVCTPADAFRPDHAFACEDETICRFVREDAQRPGTPARNEANKLIPDATGGMMCAFKPGRTFVSLRAGTVQARVPVDVRGGAGPCIIAEVAETQPAVVLSAAQSQPQPVPRRDEPAPPLLKPKTFEVAAIPALAPPPVQPAPAPPGGGAPKYEEERESATESAEMTALPVATRSPSPVTGGLIGFALVVTVAAIARRVKPRAQPQHVLALARSAGVLSRRRPLT